MPFQMEADLPSNLTCLKNVDALLRCPICFDFLNISMMTKCSHNFCSLCVRKFISYKLECPLCKSPTVEQDLRNNRLLDDLVTNFQMARQQLSKANFDSPPISPKTEALAVKCEIPREKGPKRNGSILTHFFQRGPKTSPTTEASPPQAVKEEPIEEEVSTLGQQPSTPDSLVALQDIKPVIKVECPVCSVGVSQHFINKHLDNCLTRGKKKESLRSFTSDRRRPMGKLVYTLLTLQVLKRKLKECHLSVQGTRDQLVRRHQEFVHIYNAQCDSLNPRSAKDIAKEVEANEKTRNQLQGKAKPVMVFSKNQSLEEIDEIHSNYRKQHISEYSRLTAQVRGRLETTKQTLIKQEVCKEGEEAQEACSADGTAEVKCSTDSKECLLMMSEETGADQQVSVGKMSRSPSPSYSDVSISSSISDVFGSEPERNFENVEKSSVRKRAPCSRKGGVASPPLLRKRCRKAIPQDGNRT